jgi:hypothetical protein
VTSLLTNSEIAELSEQVDRFMDGDKDALSPNDVSRMLAEIFELRKRRTHALLALVDRAHQVKVEP